ncbi:transcriptional antiterminator, partial [Rhodobacterales bacterium]
GLEDKSDDAHLYLDKFEAFDSMVKQLVTMSGCRHIHREIRKLPTIDGYSKHLLVDGNPRCVAFHRIKKDGQEYALIEVDTSDNKNKLSTLLLKEQDVSFDWEQTIRELEMRLLKGSLAWPTKFLKKKFCNGFKR